MKEVIRDDVAYARLRDMWERLREEEYLKIEILAQEVVTDIGVFKRGQQTDVLPKELRNQLLDAHRAQIVLDVTPDMAKVLQSQDDGKRN